MLRKIASCVLLASLAVGCGQRPDSSQDKDAVHVQGEWDFIAGESRSGSGKVVGEVITISGDSFTDMSGNIKFSATFSMDSAKSPKQIDFKHAIGSVDPGASFGPRQHRNLQGIYEIADNMMRICVDESGTGRPSAFAGSGPNVVMILKRK